MIEQTTVQNLAEDVIDILDGLNIEKAHFCGISMGGMTALWLGIHHADRFHSITVANSAAKIWTEEGWNARADAVTANGLADLVATTHTRWFSEQFDYQTRCFGAAHHSVFSDYASTGLCRILPCIGTSRFELTKFNRFTFSNFSDCRGVWILRYHSGMMASLCNNRFKRVNLR